MKELRAGEVMDNLLNGMPTDSISVYDRGLAYGDGVFETMAVRAGEPLLFHAHVARLQQGCSKLAIPVPDAELCREEIAQLCSGRTGILKLIITRGSAGRGYTPQRNMQPNRVLMFSKWEAYPSKFYTDGIQVEICRTRISRQEQLAGIKHLNRLENVLAASEFDANLIQEGLMLDYDNRIIECTRSNIFFIKNGQLHTPDLQRCGVNGVMRNYILQCARDKGIQTVIRDISMDEGSRMDEAFVSNSLIGVWPVVRLGDKISYTPDMVFTVQKWTLDCTLGYGA
jgi:4-amino-4-deoxychorismate lyase